MSSIIEKFTDFFQDDVTEVMLNEAGKIYLDKTSSSEFEVYNYPSITRETLDVFAGEIAGLNNKTFNELNPLLNASLPSGERVQIVRPPACIDNQYIVSIRKNIHKKLTTDYYENSGYFDNVNIITNAEEHRIQKIMNSASIQLIQQNKVLEGLKLAVREKKSIMICGAMSSGKTTLASALIGCIDKKERIGVIEDTQELDFDLPNAVRLLANEENKVCNGAEIIKVCFRLLLGRIIVGELRNSLVVQYFRSLMTSCKGNISTAHATTPSETIELITDLYREAMPTSKPEDVRRLFKASVDIVVFADYDGHIRDCGSIYLPKMDSSL